MPNNPSDTVIVAVNAANTRLNGRVDTLQPIGGQLVGNTQSFSQQVVNDAWRKMQNRLADARYSGLQQETLFAAVPAASSTDPALQVNISFSGYFDGMNLLSAPALPAGFIQPYELTERQNGTTNLFTEMDQIFFSLPKVPKQNWNREWLWRSNAIYLPGALVSTDIFLLYAGLLVDFQDGALPWFQQPIPILNSIDCLADYICREIEIARNNAAGAMAFQQSAEDGARLICNQDSSGPKSIYKTSEFGKMQDRFTPNSGADTEAVKR
jgi:hypothetical protein